MARTYTTYLPDNGGDTCLPWIALVMISLSLAEHSMSRPDIVQDIVESTKAKKDVKPAVYASVWSAMNRLESMDCVLVHFQGKTPKYRASARGRRLFAQQLAAYDASHKLNKMSDSKVFG